MTNLTSNHIIMFNIGFEIRIKSDKTSIVIESTLCDPF